MTNAVIILTTEIHEYTFVFRLILTFFNTLHQKAPQQFKFYITAHDTDYVPNNIALIIRILEILQTSNGLTDRYYNADSGCV